MNVKLVPVEDVSESTYDKTCGIESEVEKRFKYVIDYFQKHNPDPTTELKYKNGYELLVAVILSARCTDKRVNMVTPALFEKYPSFDKLAKAKTDDVYDCINSITFPNNKADYLVRMANMVITRFKGELPKNENELEKLPGVGRKTANVVVATLFNKPTIGVDIHVSRVSERIGLTTGAKNPLETEEQLANNVPKEVASKMSHWLILHGRHICTAIGPKCNRCGTKDVCRYYDINKW